MSGIVNDCIRKCITKGKSMWVARRYLRMKFNINLGDNAIINRFKNINQNK